MWRTILVPGPARCNNPEPVFGRPHGSPSFPLLEDVGRGRTGYEALGGASGRAGHHARFHESDATATRDHLGRAFELGTWLDRAEEADLHLGVRAEHLAALGI